MNSKRMKIAIEKVYNDLISMGRDEFKALLKKHKNNEYAIILRKMWNDNNERIKSGGSIFNFGPPPKLKTSYFKGRVDPNNKTQMFFIGLIIGIILTFIVYFIN